MTPPGEAFETAFMDQDNPENTSAAVNVTTRAEGEYRVRLEKFKRRTTDLESTDRLFSRLRMLAFVSLLFLGLIAAGNSSMSWWWLAIPAAVFLALMVFHQPYVRRLDRTRRARDFYIGCLARLSGEWRSTGETGEEFAEVGHPFASDLDVFGVGSLFQRINLCRTLPGRRRLANWLTEMVERDEIETRQRQTESLKDELDLREALAVIDDRVDWGKAEVTIQQWLASSIKPFATWGLWAARLLGVTSIIVLILIFGQQLSVSAIILVMLLQSPFVYFNRQRIQSVMKHVDAIEKPLAQLAEVTKQFESYPFREKSLQQLQQKLTADGVIASDRIHELSGRINWMNSALRNQFFLSIAWMLGLFLHLPHKIERWKVGNGSRVKEWLETVTILEALNSVAAFNYEREDFSVPTLSDDQAFVAEELGHPLIGDEECIRNDVSLTADVPLMLISGSNMSGKSTLLRSVGSNLILASCGAVVNAKSLTTHPFQLGTAMRISDSLQEGRSLFFSVVQRLKSVVDLTQQDRTVLFLLDEILSGTNSHDRRRGAEAVIRTLVSNGGFGMVTTHDLSLTEIVDSLEGKAVNMHFEDQVEDGSMTFDYQLREGVVQKSNAIELMRMMGLDV